MQRIRRRVSSGARRNMSVRTVQYNNPGVVLANAQGLQSVVDELNNVGRLCSLPGDKTPRTWAVQQAFRSPIPTDWGRPTIYALRNTITGACSLGGLEVSAPDNILRMHNLY
jgi:hypothetical protein